MNKKVAFLIPGLDNGGAERVISNLSLYMSGNYEKKILLYDMTRLGYPYSGEIIDLNIGCIDSKKPLYRRFCIKVYKTFFDVVRLKRIKRQYNIQTTISFLVDTNILNLLSRSGDKIIVSARNYNSLSLSGIKKMIYGRLMKHLYSKSDIVIAISEGVKQDLINNFNIVPDKIKVIYNPYDINKIQKFMDYPIDEEYNILFKSPVVINVARLTKQKGQNHLIKAFSIVKSKISNVNLVLLGEGPLEGELRDLVKYYNLEKNVFFLGFHKNPFKFIKHSSVFVFSSNYEGFGNALVEAMACGIPVISTDCRSGPREILAPETNFNNQTDDIEYASYGVLTPVCNDNLGIGINNSEKILAESIIKMLNDIQLSEKYSLVAQKRAGDFDIRSIIPQWEEIL